MFFDKDEMYRYALDAQLSTFFAIIEPRFRHATREDLDAIKKLNLAARELISAKQDFAASFRRLVTIVPGSDAPPRSSTT
jgi:hypothetical protein